MTLTKYGTPVCPECGSAEAILIATKHSKHPTHAPSKEVYECGRCGKTWEQAIPE